MFSSERIIFSTIFETLFKINTDISDSAVHGGVPFHRIYYSCFSLFIFIILNFINNQFPMRQTCYHLLITNLIQKRYVGVLSKKDKSNNQKVFWNAEQMQCVNYIEKS